ncbi:uncharacterized protein LOC111012434 [Momordica charantia]|uniref:Uncharacterized protein LOC111012434 n=1 Tax=Momordica charantia TaxID=3673 RepID=A0A6J1CMW5_MOMCH|nr:uncharacterized protein LOC111012434 [Momordica charantia]
MAEEFHESDIIFSDHHHHRRRVIDYGEFLAAAHRKNSKKNNTNKKKKKKDFAASSLPIQIPESIFRYTSDAEELEDEWDSEDIVPPHVLIGRRVAGKMAFSVCTGNGRTLKGRDLSQVRNSILRMTGFLET